MKKDFTKYNTVDKLITGCITIEKNIQFNNVEADEVVIEPNVTARLFGKIKERLVLKQGATLYLHGSIHGNVENNGGTIIVF
ncbi:MAG: hypothetical protein M3R27_02710 [Bacteroidota bacterium]|nr:hypothetical protein [Bacteroidota bacterium]